MENVNASLANFSLKKESAACKRDSHSIGDVNVAANKGMNPRKASAHTTSWLEALQVHNHHRHNNNNIDYDEMEKSTMVSDRRHVGVDDDDVGDCGDGKRLMTWECLSCDSYQLSGYCVNLSEDDKVSGSLAKKAPLSVNGISSDDEGAAAVPPLSPFGSDIGAAYDICGAASLTPPLIVDDQYDAGSATAAAGDTSTRTSLNNSTENLSYISDSFYADEVLILGQEHDVEVEDLSLNSDDCIYAYRGEGIDFHLPLEQLDSRSGDLPASSCAEEETDFLEMDFEPDPLSDLEYTHNTASLNTTNNAASALNVNANRPTTTQQNQRQQLFSSPIDDLPPPPKALQSQSTLSKNFARITLHLDQIQRDYHDDTLLDTARDCVNSTRIDASITPTHPRGKGHGQSSSTASSTCHQINTAAHSLPNTLHEHFGNRSISESAVVMATNESLLMPPMNALMQNSSSDSKHKATGAKPKRLSTTFSSTSSTTSSKNSSKSRRSLRSSYQPTAGLYGSNSFDERSVSCSEFRTARDLMCNQGPNHLPIASHTAPSAAALLNAPDYSLATDDTCLDCLEKEFLFSTIGKALDTQDCMKCRKRVDSLALYQRSASSEQSHYRRSASPGSYFLPNQSTSPTSRLFSCEFLHIQARQRREWDLYMRDPKGNDNKSSTITTTITTHSSQKLLMGRNEKDTPQKEGDSRPNQRTPRAVARFIKSVPDKPVSVTVPTKNLNKLQLEQALDTLHVAYNRELLKKYFNKYNSSLYNSNAATTTTTTGSNISTSLPTLPMARSDTSAYLKRDYHNLLSFLLHASKGVANYNKLKKIIKKTTQQQVIVQYKKDSSLSEMEMVTVKVSDILYYWSMSKNLEQLKQLDQRFVDNNILGKIANIIRQSQQPSAARRPLPEFISIPQYYPSGFLTLTKNC